MTTPATQPLPICPGAAVFHVVVEAVPGGSWIWTVRRPGDPPRLAHYGTDGTIQEAMQLAELAVQ